MAINIRGEIYNMQKIEDLSKKKLQITKKIVNQIDTLKKEVINEEKLERKQILTFEKEKKLLHQFEKGIDMLEIVKRNEKNEMVFLKREEYEFAREYYIIKELKELIDELKRLADIELKYFEHYTRKNLYSFDR